MATSIMVTLNIDIGSFITHDPFDAGPSPSLISEDVFLILSQNNFIC